MMAALRIAGLVILSLSLCFAPGQLLWGQNTDDSSAPLQEEEVDSEKKPKVVGPTSTDPTAAKIIEYHLKVRGGMEKIKALQSLRIKGTVKEGSKSTFKMTWYRKAPNSYRVEQHYRKLGRDYITARVYDGDTAWSQELSPKEKLPQKMGGNIKAFQREAEFYDVFVDYQEKGNHFAFRGKDQMGNISVLLVEGKIKDGPVMVYTFDAKRYQILKVDFKDSFAGQLMDAEQLPVKLERVNGVIMETAYKFRVRGKIYREITYESVEANVDIPDSLFTMPKPKEFWLRQR